MNRNRSGEISRYIWIILSISVCLLIAALAVYWYWFYIKQGRGISIQPEQWGQFGDYLGGVLNPIFALAAFLGLLVTIHLSNKEIIRNDIERQKSDLLNMINLAHKELNVVLNEKLKITLYKNMMSAGSEIKLPAGEKELTVLEAALYEKKSLKQMHDEHRVIISKIHELLALLRAYCKNYEAIGGDNKITDFYRIYHLKTVDALVDCVMIDMVTAGFFKEERTIKYFEQNP